MKKFVLLFCIGLFCVSCDPPQNAWIWLVKNNTEQTLKFKFPYSENYQTKTLEPGDGIFISDILTNTSRPHNIDFYDYFRKVVSEYGENVYWQILSEDDVVLKTWSYSDRGLPYQRFFDKTSWHYAQGSGFGFVVADYSWTFEILPEDISSN